jgi:hypothetical protein
MKTRFEREKVTIHRMIRLYCRYHQHPEGNLCNECNELLDYALERVEKCIYGEDKPVCSECKVHCYKKDMRERVKIMMRFAGPRMLFHHPLLAFMHMIDKRK